MVPLAQTPDTHIEVSIKTHPVNTNEHNPCSDLGYASDQQKPWPQETQPDKNLI